MYKSLKSLILLLFLAVLFTGCSSDETKDTVSQNEDTTSDDSSTMYVDEEEHLETYAERKLIHAITAPFELHHDIQTVKGVDNGKISIRDKNFTYSPKAGFIGLDTVTLRLHQDKDYDKFIDKTYYIDVKEQPLEGFRDFIIFYRCETISKHFGSKQSIDLDIINNNSERIVKVYDNLKSSSGVLPRYPISRIQIEYFNATEEEEPVNHHRVLKENLEHNILLTCNYNAGYSSILYSLSSKDWKAVSKIGSNGYAGVNYTFIRNALYFHISSLSDLHNRIYQKEYKQLFSSEEAFTRANKFMDKIFPDAHYSGELYTKYDTENQKIKNIFNQDNERYYTLLSYLADEYTSGSITNLLEKIANNYESFYISDSRNCLDKNICGLLFPEYTTSLTQNPDFTSGLDNWNKNENVNNVSSSGKIEYLPTKKIVKMEFNAHTVANSSTPISAVALYQTQTIQNEDLDDYFVSFDIEGVVGHATGHVALSGLKSSGLAGAYTCYKDINNETLGCLAWSDHTNKTKFIWVPTANGLSFDFNRLHSNDTFYNVELKETFRRTSSSSPRYLYSTNLGDFTKKHLPKVYEQKDKIHSIEYGIFTTEFRSNTDGACYHCTATITANKIELLKVKK